MVTRLGVLLIGCLAAFGACAAEVAGVQLDDRAHVGSTDLVLNGAGLRKRLFFQVYAMGLYLPSKAATAEGALAAGGNKRVQIHMLRDVSAAEFSSALMEGVQANQSQEESRALEGRVSQFVATLMELKEARKGMRFALDWNAGGTQLMVDGKPTGKPIEGEDFYRALLRIWLGAHPVQEDLKKALLGNP
jgi:Chalcone isomerase-like